MHHGEGGDRDVVLPQAVALGDVRPAETEVAVGQDDALRVARCAGGVEHDRRVVGVERPLLYRREARSCQRGDRRLDGLGPPPQDNAVQARQVAFDLIHKGRKVFVGDEQRRFRIVEEVGHLPGRIQGVYGHDNAPCLDDGEEGEERLAAVRMENSHMVPGTDAETFETIGDPVRDGIKFPVRYRPLFPVDEDPVVVTANPFFEKPHKVHNLLFHVTGWSVRRRRRWSGR